jgi:hypothetical protein
MQDVEEQGLNHGGRVIPTVKIEAAEGEGVLDVVENKPILASACPFM